MDGDLPAGRARDELLADVLAEALRRREVRQAVRSSDLSPQHVAAAVERAKPEVFAAAEAQEARYRELAGPPGDLVVGGRAWKLVAIQVAVLVLPPAVGLSLLVTEIAGHLGATPGVADAISVGAGVVGGAVGGLVMYLWQNGRRLRFPTYLSCAALVGFTLLAVLGAPNPVETLVGLALIFGLLGGLLFLGFERLDIRPEYRWNATGNAYHQWRTALLTEGVLPVVYDLVNEVTRTGYSTRLTAWESAALTSGDHLRMHVEVPAGAHLARLTAQLGGGSFAVAGPRGSGKTNLLRAFCGGRYREPDRVPDLAVQVAAPVEYVPQEFVVHLFAETCEAVTSYFGRRGGRRRWWRPRGWSGVKPHPLVADARANLLLLNYVRAYTNEVSGKGGFKGFELAGKRAVTLTGRALTYPELVKLFRDFLLCVVAELASEEERKPGRVIIAIDELDRIGTGEPARRFLNEVKAVFDVPGCHYLVSVSTEAQHDFELSGIGLRSVFDSSFDEVVRVDYLDFEYAKRLLRRYVLGLSEQFHALAYVFSGGLARQLVRTARAILDLGRDHPGRPLADVARALVDAELTRACQATADALTAVDDRNGVTGLLSLLDQPPVDLIACADRIRTAYGGPSERVRQLKDALAARVRFLETVLEVFTDDLTEERTRALDFDALARARRYAGTNPAAGLDLLDGLARRWTG